VVQSSPWSTLGVTLQRILGTGVGVLAASLWVNAAGRTWWSFLLAVLVALLVARALPWSIGGQLQIPVAVVFVLALGPGSFGADVWRVLDVVIGGLVGIAAVFVFPPRPRPEAFETALAAYRDALVGTLEEVAQESGRHAAPLPEETVHDYVTSSRRLRDLADIARAALARLVESTHFNMRAGGLPDELGGYALRLRRLTGIGLQVRGIVGAANRLYDREGPPVILTGDRLRELIAAEVTLIGVVLGNAGEPVCGTDRELAQRLGRELDDELRRTADRVAVEKGDVGGVLESVSLLGRLDHVRAQLIDFPGWEG